MHKSPPPTINYPPTPPTRGAQTTTNNKILWETPLWETHFVTQIQNICITWTILIIICAKSNSEQQTCQTAVSPLLHLHSTTFHLLLHLPSTTFHLCYIYTLLHSILCYIYTLLHSIFATFTLYYIPSFATFTHSSTFHLHTSVHCTSHIIEHFSSHFKEHHL